MSIFKNSHSLRFRFAVGFGILFTFFLAIAFITIYLSLYRFGRDDYYSRLKDRALTTYQLFAEVDQIDSSLLDVIDRNTPSSIAPLQRVTIFDDSTIVFSNADAGQFVYDHNFFERIKASPELFQQFGNDQLYGMYRQKNEHHFYVIVKGHDTYGLRKMNFLKWIMLAVYVLGVMIGWTVTYFFVKRIIHPLEVLNTNVQHIDYSNLDSRLPQRMNGTEVDNLSINFNQMLSRLEQSFAFQKDFVHYASHELRTPLAAMIGVTENSLNSPLTEEQFHKVLNQLLEQQQNLTDITNSLLLLSGSKVKDTSHEYPLIRLDELVFRAVEISKNLFPEVEIDVNFQGELSNEDFLLIHANPPLILMAFNNLLKNGIQYSTGKCMSLLLNIDDKVKTLRFVNPGSAIPYSERQRIFTPFYRATTSENIKGHGLGLALVKQIIKLHRASIDYSYEEGNNVFTIVFK